MTDQRLLAVRTPHPIVFLVLFLPFGITGGYVSVTLGYLLSSAGATVAAIAALVGVTYIPNNMKVLWAPLVDTTLSAKRWYLISVTVAGLGLLATAFVPRTVAMMPVFTALVFATAFGVTFSAMSVERLMAITTPHEQKGRAGGWSQAGNLGGSGLGGGAGLWIAQHNHIPWLSGATLGLICLACAAVLPLLHEPARDAEARSYGRVLVDAAKDVWELIKTRIGLLTCFICLLPIGCGAASNLWAAIAKDWGAGADEVALVGGVLSGLITIVGSVFGGFLCDLIGRRRGYMVYGIVLALIALAMAIGPRTPLGFLLFASLYNLGLGLIYGAFSAMVLEAIGKGAAATKYNLIASLSNMPIMAMTLANGWAQTKWGSGGMLEFEAGVGLVAVIVFLAVQFATRGMTWGMIFRPRTA